MAQRPVFVPLETGSRLVDEIQISFDWNPGFAPSQKKKNVAALHETAVRKGLTPLLEISSKSEEEVGQRLSAFNLKIDVGGGKASIESAYQGSKVFENGGPYTDLYLVDSRTAKKDPRLRNSGRLIGFRFEGRDYPLSPTTAFYDWLYLSALYPHREWLRRLHNRAGYTDIEFNPEYSLNCQARSFATFVALERRGILEKTISSFDAFKTLLQSASI